MCYERRKRRFALPSTVSDGAISAKELCDKQRKDLEFAVVDRVSRPGTDANLARPEHVKQTPNGQSFPCPPRLITTRTTTETRGVYNVFHVSNLRKYIHNSSHVLEYEPVELREDMTYEEYPVCVLDREERKLRSRIISYVKVQWSNHAVRKATWELEKTMRKEYPHLFESTS
uniref:Chromo domain-containing protein n=1 Tax=Ananas comosus var. bracteatus TaxID=296719 RepID=A0A6V7QN22_ANACO|nr:unnamed protein product [Ananas comosus var. bracteatus]